MMESVYSTTLEAEAKHIEIRFITKEKKFSIAQTPYSLPSNSTREQLNSLINSILQSENEGGDNERTVIEFDFLVDSEIIRLPLLKHIEEKNLSTESVLEIEYILRQRAPEVEDSLQHDDWVSCLQASEDGKWFISGSYDSNLYIWNLSDRKIHRTITNYHQSAVKCLTILENEEQDDIIKFASGSDDQTVRIFHYDVKLDVVTCPHICRGHARSVETVASNPSSSLLCSGSFDNTIKLWRLDGSKSGDGSDGDDVSRKKVRLDSEREVGITMLPRCTLSGHKESVSSLCWQVDHEKNDVGKIFSSSWDHTIRIWDLNVGKQTHLLQGSKAFLSISYSPHTHLILTGSVDRHIRLWDPREGNILVKSVYSSHTGWVSGVRWSISNNSPNLFISSSFDGMMKLWDVRSPKLSLYDMEGHEDKILCCDWSTPQYMMSGGADGKVKLFAA